MKFTPTDTIKSVLEKLKAENAVIDLTLKSGKNYAGKILSFGQNCFELQIVGDRSYFNAIIQIDSVESVEHRARGS